MLLISGSIQYDISTDRYNGVNNTKKELKTAIIKFL